MAIDNKLSNIIGTKIPQWVINQLSVRSAQNARLDKRDNDNLVYLANKTAWVRLVSSVNISANDLDYFSKLVPNVSKPEDLAKQYVLFGGTSVYINQTGQPSYNIRSGMSGIKPNAAENGAYGMLGTSEIQDYGYRPMPGITNVNIETQGRLGSVRQAIINFKCWDKAQIDIIDAIYFKLGYSMFLEWGHTYYYPSPGNPNAPGNEQVNKLKSTEFSIVDPFAPGLTKESIFRQISVNSRESEGNYDAMLGIVTNFNFSYNQEGGYDCTLRLMSLGVLGDSIKINNPSILPDILRDEVLQLSSTLEIQQGLNAGAEADLLAQQAAKLAAAAQKAPTIFAYINTKEIKRGILKPEYGFAKSELEDTFFEPVTPARYKEIIIRYGIGNSEVEESIPEFTNGKFFREYLPGPKEKYDFVYDDSEYTGPTLYLQKYGIRIPEEDTQDYISSLTIDSGRFRNILTDGAGNVDSIVNSYFAENLRNTLVNNLGTGVVESYKSPKIPYIGLNNKVYLVSFEIDLNEDILNVFESTQKVNYVIVGSKKEVQKFSLQDSVLKELLKVFIFGTNNLNTEFTGGDDFSFGGSLDDVYKLSIIKASKYSVDSGKQIIKRAEDLLDSSGAIKEINYVNDQTSGNTFELSVLGTYQYNLMVSRNKPGFSNEIAEEQLETFTANYRISITDTALITSVKPVDNTLLFKESLKIESENLLNQQNQIEQALQAQQKIAQQELATQVAEALSYQSALEIILRTIQVKSLNQAFYQTGKVDLEIGRKVYKFEMWRKRNRPFLNQILSNGIYSGFIETLIDSPEKISNANYKTDEDKFLVNAKYGFATTLLGSDSKDPFENLVGKEVNYSEILNAYVVPYQIDQEIVAGVKTNHPVYVPFGLLVFLLNHVCSLYDTALESSAEESAGTSVLGAQQRALTAASRLAKVKQKPLVYLDYNPNLNFFLTNPQQLSTNPWVALIPYEGRFDDYRKLFDQDVIDNNSIRPLSGSQQSTPLFNPETQDLLSWQLPKIKDSSDLYRGKLMNVLINIDYLTSLIKDYSFKDGTNNVFLKPFLEHILSDVNKYLGNFNALRLSYNDRANTFQFVDDQYIPSLPNEPQIPYKPSSQDIQNRTEIPLVGRDSIAKSFELKTEISSRLASMIAISANSNPNEQVQNSINGDSFGFLNKNYSDRYIPRRLSAGDEKTAQKEGEKTTSIQFNQTISDFYSKINPAYSDVSQATSFFIDKMSVQKNQTGATRSSVLIPVGANIGLDGIGGLTMGQAFTISDRLLPYNYYSNNPGNIFDGYVNQVGFVIVGLSHVIDNNTWTTNIRTQMMPVKDNSLFGTPPPVLKKNEGAFGINEYNIINATNANRLREVLASLQYLEKGNELANAGDITPKLMSEAGALFREIKNTYPNLIIQVTGGNDIFHLNRSDSRHKSGNGLDFIIVNGTDQDVINVGNLVAEFAKKYQISYKDEYDESKQSAGATGNHFHISV